MHKLNAYATGLTTIITTNTAANVVVYTNNNSNRKKRNEMLETDVCGFSKAEGSPDHRITSPRYNSITFTLIYYAKRQQYAHN